MAAATIPGAVASRPLRSLLSRPSPAAVADRAFFHHVWFKGFNNARHVALLGGLRRVDPYLVTCSDQRIVRGLQFRALKASGRWRNRAVLARAARAYRYLYAFDLGQIPLWPGPVVADVDDPRFSGTEAALLSRPNVAAYVVTAESAARRYADLGVRAPAHVIPQGVPFSTLDPAAVERVAGLRRPGEVVMGWIAPWLLTERDEPGSPHALDHLLDLWTEIGARAPGARLWLVGQPSARLRARVEGRDDVWLAGRVPSADVLAYIANFDLALYARTRDFGPASIKVTECLGMGVPTVGYDLEATRVLTETGGGVTVGDGRAFVEAAVALAGDPARRADLGARAREAGRGFDWDVLLDRYEREVFDVYLPARA